MTSSRSDCRSGAHRCAPIASRQALYCQIHHSQLTRHELAELLSVHPSTLSNWGDPEKDDRIPHERLEHLLRLTDDNAAYVRFLGELQGQVVYTVPRGAQSGRAAKMLKEFSELLDAVSAREDGITSAEEAARIAREGNDVIAAVAAQIVDATHAAARGPQ